MGVDFSRVVLKSEFVERMTGSVVKATGDYAALITFRPAPWS